MPKTDCAQRWANNINRAIANSVAAIIASGQAFIDAKKALGHGEFGRMFASHADPVATPVNCTIGTAERLMKIAAHPILSKSAHAPTLPPSWGTLYELTKLPDDRLEEAIADGVIHADMERSAAERLLREARSEFCNYGEDESPPTPLPRIIRASPMAQGETVRLSAYRPTDQDDDDIPVADLRAVADERHNKIIENLMRDLEVYADRFSEGQPLRKAIITFRRSLPAYFIRKSGGGGGGLKVVK